MKGSQCRVPAVSQPSLCPWQACAYGCGKATSSVFPGTMQAFSGKSTIPWAYRPDLTVTPEGRLAKRSCSPLDCFPGVRSPKGEAFGGTVHRTLSSCVRSSDGKAIGGRFPGKSDRGFQSLPLWGRWQPAGLTDEVAPFQRTQMPPLIPRFIASPRSKC